jgi:hypothetical protein
VVSCGLDSSGSCRDQWRSVVEMIMNLRFLYKEWNFLSRCVTISF